LRCAPQALVDDCEPQVLRADDEPQLLPYDELQDDDEQSAPASLHSD
jgi:hypothetical protein